jgi:hypothetical protein
MEEQKKFINDIIKHSKFEIAPYHEVNLEDKHSIFIGTPQKDPNDKTKIILLIDPFSAKEKYIEFPIQSIGHIEEIGTITSNDGKSALKIKLWVKKGSVALESKPFIVK